MNAPHLNRALGLEGVVRTPDGAGGFSEAWTALGTLWAEVLPGSGSDTLGEERMLSAVPYRIDLFDDEIESIRTFDVDTQRSLYKVNEDRKSVV